MDEKNLEKDLIRNRKDGFLGKQRFLDEANAQIYENKRIAVKKAKYAYENSTKNQK